MIDKLYSPIKYFIHYFIGFHIVIGFGLRSVCSFFSLALFCTAYTQTNSLENPSVLAIHKENDHVSIVPFPDEQTATGLEKEKSPYYLSLNGSWKFKYIPEVSSLPNNFYKSDFDVNSWETIRVPGLINTLSSDLKTTQNISTLKSAHKVTALYSTNFIVSGIWEDRQTFIVFDGVGSMFSLWVNGQNAGYSKNNFSPAEFNISPFLKEGKNVLTLRLYFNSNSNNPTSLTNQGIYNDVYLYSKPNIAISNYKVVTDLDKNYTDATLKLSVELKRLIDKRFKHLSLEASLYDAEKHKMFTEKSVELNFIKNDFIKIELEHNLQNPEKWDAEKPYLYILALTLKDKSGAVVESVSSRVGVRKVEIRNGSMLVNGRRVIIRGINRIENATQDGQFSDKSTVEEEIKRMKQVNINALRTVDWSGDQYLCDLCDEYGIYLCPESELNEPVTTGKSLSDSVWNASSIDRVKGIVETFRNHPSIIFWSLNDHKYPVYKHSNIINWLHQNDPDRPVADIDADIQADLVAPANLNLPEYDSLRKINKPIVLSSYSDSLFCYLAGLSLRSADSLRFDQGGFIAEKIGHRFIIKDSVTNLQGKGNEFLNDNAGVQTDFSVYRHIIQPVKITAVNLMENKIRIQNSYEYTNLSSLKGLWKLKDCGTVVQEGELSKLDIPAGTGEVVDIPFTTPDIKPGHEYLLDIYFQLADNTKFAFQGHEVAREQFRIPYDSPLPLFNWDKKDKSLDLFENSESYRITGKDFSVNFNKEQGVITSFQYKGKDLFKKGPAMDFDNITENFSARNSEFQKLGLHHLKTIVEKISAVKEKAGYVEVRVNKKVYNDSTNHVLDNTISYGIFPQGDIIINQNISFQGNYLPLKDILLSSLGVKMEIPSDLEQCKWFGRGSVLHSSDYQNNITNIDTYTSLPMKENDFQNEGAKSDVRWLTLTDKEGVGFAVLGQPYFDNFAINGSTNHTEKIGIHDSFSIILGYHSEEERSASIQNYAKARPVAVNYCFRFRPIDHNNNIAEMMCESPYTDAVVINPKTYAVKYTEPISMSCATKGSDIHFTLDGSEPNFKSPLYTGTFRIIKKASIKAKAFAPGKIASTITTADYDVLIPLFKSRTVKNIRPQSEVIDVPLRRICKLGILINEASVKKSKVVLADAKLITRDGKTVYLSDLVPVNYGNSQGKPLNNLAFGGDSISVAGDKFTKGLGVQAPVELWYEIGTDCTRFKTLLGVEKGNALPSVTVLGIKSALKR